MNRFKNILYVLNNETNEHSPSLARAVSLAKNNQSDLTLLQVHQAVSSSFYSKKIGISEQEFKNKVEQLGSTKLERLISSIGSELNAKTEQKTGKKYIEIIRLIQANNYDLVIKEVDDIDWLDRFIGSDDMNLLRKCPCPLWLMKKDEKPDYDHIVAAVDFNNDHTDANEGLNRMILDLGSSLSLSELAKLYVVNAYDVPEAGFISLWVEQPDKIEKELFEAEYQEKRYKMRGLLENLKDRLGEKSYNYVAPHPIIVQGDPGREIPKVAESVNADLVIMGTVARTGIAGLVIGNTAENILAQINCSVLAIKPEGFVSPIS